jgi:hypothetical protein
MVRPFYHYLMQILLRHLFLLSLSIHVVEIGLVLMLQLAMAYVAIWFNFI